jgi:hypothetical protein
MSLAYLLPAVLLAIRLLSPTTGRGVRSMAGHDPSHAPTQRPIDSTIVLHVARSAM